MKNILLLGASGRTGIQVLTVAQFLVDCLETNGYIKKAAIILEKSSKI